MGNYLRPTDLDHALRVLNGGPVDVIAGGTDFYPARVGHPPAENVLDISAISELRGIEDRGDHWLIGALTTWSDMIEADLPPCFETLKLAAREVGGIQIQNRGTIVGNICNASPAADGVPGLLALDAQVQMASSGGARVLTLADFILSNRRTARRPDELVTGLAVAKPAPNAHGTFMKLGARKYLVISIAMVAAVIEPDTDGRVYTARVAVGACSPVARRLPDLEAALRGRYCDATLSETPLPEHLAPIAPIDDVRGAAAYRRDSVLTLLRRALERIGTEMETGGEQ